jgi:outer membrane lipoprotein SlyB
MARRIAYLLLLTPALATVGCHSPYRSDQGALLGGLGGAGVGAIVGNQVGHTGAGAVIGGLTGALAGSVVGDQLDQIEARNRAEIQARLGRPPGPGAVSVEDVVEMSQRGVNEQVLVDHIRARGVTRALAKDDLILLSQAQVSPRVVTAMQEPRPVPMAGPPYPAPGPVIVEEHIYAGPPPPPYWYRPHYHYHHHPRHYHPGYRVGISYSN